MRKYTRAYRTWRFNRKDGGLSLAYKFAKDKRRQYDLNLNLINKEDMLGVDRGEGYFLICSDRTRYLMRESGFTDPKEITKAVNFLLQKPQRYIGLESNLLSLVVCSKSKTYPLELFVTELCRRAYKEGKRIIIVPIGHTSTTCYQCGFVKKPSSARIYDCPACGWLEDRDINAALVVKKKAIQRLNGRLWEDEIEVMKKVRHNDSRPFWRTNEIIEEFGSGLQKGVLSVHNIVYVLLVSGWTNFPVTKKQFKRYEGLLSQTKSMPYTLWTAPPDMSKLKSAHDKVMETTPSRTFTDYTREMRIFGFNLPKSEVVFQLIRSLGAKVLRFNRGGGRSEHSVYVASPNLNQQITDFDRLYKQQQQSQS